MSAFTFELAEHTDRPTANLDKAELRQVERVVLRYGVALDERVRVVSAMRTAAITQDEIAYRRAERRLQGVRDEMEDCSLELKHRNTASL